MAETTAIEWTDASANIWRGCAKVAPGCANCYAEALERRFGTEWGKGKPRVYCKTWLATLERLDRKAAREGRKLKVFINSHSDFFEDHDGPIVDHESRILVHANDRYEPEITEQHESCSRVTMSDLRHDAFQAFDRLQNLIFILVTKRPENIRKMWPEKSKELVARDWGEKGGIDAGIGRTNVWLLTSVSEQETANRNIPELLKCRDLVPVLGVSAEPLLGAVDFTPWMFSSDGFVSTPNDGPVHREDGGAALDWVIVGGESGPKSRPCNLGHVRSLVEQCQAATVPVFVKQLGARCIVTGKERQNWPIRDELTTGLRHIGLADRKGGNMEEWPEDLRVREFPVLPTEGGGLYHE